MKSYLKFSGMVLILVVSSIIFSQQASAQTTQVSFQEFYDQLSPYGQWVNYSSYGYVWMPDAESDFVPYSTNGHWILTEYGWAWVSEYAWGWAPFHYGRWNFDDQLGWFWVPDTEWGPSWVIWRSAYGYYGWSPMKSGINVKNQYNADNNHWIFVRDRDFEKTNVSHYIVNRSEYDRIIRKSTIIKRTYTDNKRHITYVAGPRRADIQKITGKKINPVVVRENKTPGQQLNKGELQIYRPTVSQNNGEGRKSIPNKITPLEEKKRLHGNSTTNQNSSVNNKEQPKKKQIQEATAPVQTQNRNNTENNKQNRPSNKVQPQMQTKTDRQIEIKKQELPEKPTQDKKNE
jgi:hypothetical protein